jgi:hypothetical protein
MIRPRGFLVETALQKRGATIRASRAQRKCVALADVLTRR